MPNTGCKLFGEMELVIWQNKQSNPLCLLVGRWYTEVNNTKKKASSLGRQQHQQYELDPVQTSEPFTPKLQLPGLFKSFFNAQYKNIITKSRTDQDCRVLHGDAGGRGPQGSAHSMVVLETDLSFSC